MYISFKYHIIFCNSHFILIKRKIFLNKKEDSQIQLTDQQIDTLSLEQKQQFISLFYYQTQIYNKNHTKCIYILLEAAEKNNLGKFIDDENKLTNQIFSDINQLMNMYLSTQLQLDLTQRIMIQLLTLLQFVFQQGNQDLYDQYYLEIIKQLIQSGILDISMYRFIYIIFTITCEQFSFYGAESLPPEFFTIISLLIRSGLNNVTNEYLNFFEAAEQEGLIENYDKQLFDQHISLPLKKEIEDKNFKITAINLKIIQFKLYLFNQDDIYFIINTINNNYQVFTNDVIISGIKLFIANLQFDYQNYQNDTQQLYSNENYVNKQNQQNEQINKLQQFQFNQEFITKIIDICRQQRYIDILLDFLLSTEIFLTVQQQVEIQYIFSDIFKSTKGHRQSKCIRILQNYLQYDCLIFSSLELTQHLNSINYGLKYDMQQLILQIQEYENSH